jgi:hypothetical protein
MEPACLQREITMPNQSIQVHTPWMAASTRIAVLYAAVADRAARFGRAVWRGLEAQGQRRSTRELLALADRWEHMNPTLARELRSYARGGSSY